MSTPDQSPIPHDPTEQPPLGVPTSPDAPGSGRSGSDEFAAHDHGHGASPDEDADARAAADHTDSHAEPGPASESNVGDSELVNEVPEPDLRSEQTEDESR